VTTPSISTDYDQGWGRWNDMIRYSPAPFHRRRLILDALRTVPFRSVLDVGCGNGETLAAVAREHAAELVGVDLSPVVVEQNRARFPALRFFVLDIEAGALDRTFDVVICSEVVEHCRDPLRALRHLRAMTGRHLILTVPAGPRFAIDRAMGHHRHFEPRALGQALADSGFAVERMTRWGFPFHSLYKLAINATPERSLRTFASGTYGAQQKVIGTALRGLFYLSAPNRGWQLVAVARAA